MIAAEAARILELPPTATPEQIEGRFNELRAKLEDRIAKAPTPGLKEKYRRSLDELTNAFETLTLAADAANLPMLERVAELPPAPAARPPVAATGGRAAEPSRSAVAAAPAAEPARARKPAGQSREFLIVAAIAILALAGGGWFVMQQRAAKAEQARVAAEQARTAAETKKRADDERLAKEAADRTEQERVNKLTTQLRTQLAETRVEWDARESELRDAERRTGELKSELRGARDLAAPKKAEMSAELARHEIFSEWLKTYLLRHPAKVARVKAEQLIEAKSADEAATAVKELTDALAEIGREIPAYRERLLGRVGAVVIESTPAGLGFVFTDGYGRSRQGKTPARIDAVPLTHLHDPKNDGLAGATATKLGEFTAEKVSVRFQRPGWSDVTEAARVEGTDPVTFRHTSPEGALTVESLPAGVPWQATNALGWSVSGVTPATVRPAPPGVVTVKLSRPGYKDVSGQAQIAAGKTVAVSLDQRPQEVRITVAEPEAEIWVDGKLQGRKEATLTAHAPGSHQLELRHPKFARYRAPIEIKQEFTKRNYTFSFATLSAETLTCTACNGAGKFSRSARCQTCNGRGRVTCSSCSGAGGRSFTVVQGQKPLWLTCDYCKGSRTERCGNDCDNGTARWTDLCNPCGADGRRSQLQLSQ